MYTTWVLLLLITEFILFGIAYIIFKGDFISPSIVTLGFFILSTACCLYGLHDWSNVVFTGKAYLLFALSFVLMLITESIICSYKFSFRNKKSFRENHLVKINHLIYIPEPISTILFVFFMFCAFYYIYRVYQSGMDLGANSLLSAIGVNKENGKYDGLSRLLYNLTRVASYVYIVMVCHNIFSCKDKLKNNLQGILIVGFTLIITFFSGQRSSAICYVVGIVVAASVSLQNVRGFERVVNSGKFIRRLTVVAAVVVTVFYLSANLVKGVSAEREFVDYITYYFGSTTALMGNIVEDSSICHTPFAGYFGEKTFNGFWNNMYSWGFINTQPTERKWINMGSHVAHRAGNEYTFFCGPYIDFGFAGTLIFVVIFYAFFSIIYYKKILKKDMSLRRVYTVAIYIFLYTMIAMTFYQDTIRSYSRPINLAYIIYIIFFSKIFLRFKGSMVDKNDTFKKNNI